MYGSVKNRTRSASSAKPLAACLVCTCLLLGACKGTATRKLDAGKADPAENIQAMVDMIGRNAKLPSRILGAHYVEYGRGSGGLPGPTDFSFYARIKVAKEDVAKWSDGLEEPANQPSFYAAPPKKETWWIPEQAFKNLALFETKKYFGRFNGWIAVDGSTGYLYVYTFTM